MKLSKSEGGETKNSSFTTLCIQDSKAAGGSCQMAKEFWGGVQEWEGDYRAIENRAIGSLKCRVLTMGSFVGSDGDGSRVPRCLLGAREAKTRTRYWLASVPSSQLRKPD